MDALNRLRRALLRLLGGSSVESAAAGAIRPPPALRIEDGLDIFRLPILLPPELHGADPARIAAFAEAYTAQFQFDPPYRTSDSGPITLPVDDSLTEWSAGTRQAIVAHCHAAYDRNPIGYRAVKDFAQFSVGQGFNLVTRNPQVKAVLDSFILAEGVRTLERAWPIDLLTDGELMIQIFSGSEDTRGQTGLLPIRPWTCVDVEVENDVPTRHKNYLFGKNQSVAAAKMLYVGINRRSYDRRGKPEMYAILPWLRAHKLWLEDRLRQNHIRGLVVWDVAIDTTNPGIVESKAGQYAHPPTSGSIVVHSAKEQWRVLNNSVDASGASEDGRQLKLMTATGMGLPEYMLSDGANANLASATAQQLPALMTFADFQFVLVEQLYYPLFRRVLKQAVEGNKLPETVLEYDAAGRVVMVEVDEWGAELTPDQQYPNEIDTLTAFDVTYQPVTQNLNLLQVAQAYQIADNQGWASAEAAQIALGLDPAVEAERLRREARAARSDIAAGLTPPAPEPLPANAAP